MTFSNAHAITVNKLREFGRNRIVRGVAVVAGGTAGAQLIALCFSPFITRLYGPEAFGVLAAFTAIITAIAPLVSLSYPIAIVLPRTDKQAKVLVQLSLWTSLLISLAAVGVILIFGGAFAQSLSLGMTSAHFALVPLALLATACLNVANQWLIRKKLFVLRARAAVIQSALLNGAIVMIGVFANHAGVLIVLTVASNCLFAFALFYFSNRSLVGHGRYKARFSLIPKRKAAVAAMVRYRDLALYRTPQILLSNITQSAPTLVLAALIGPAVAGYYALARMALSKPVILVGTAVGDVIYPHLADARNGRKSLTRLITGSTLSLLAIGVIPFGLVIWLGPSLFSWVFGPDWSEAGEYARWLSIMLLFNLVNRPTVAAIPVLGMERWFLLYGMVSSALRVGGLFIGYGVWKSDIAAVAMFSVLGAVAYLFLICWVISASYRRDRNAALSMHTL